MNMGNRSEEIYRELTPAGVGLCAVAGAMAEGLTFIVLGIRFGSVPLPVLVFLWGLFGILVSGVLFLFDSMGTRVQEIREWARRMKRMGVLTVGESESSPEQQTAEQICEPVSAQVIYRDVWSMNAEFSSEEQRKAS